MMVDETPLMRQYTEIKKDYQDSILFFRLGDFYEMFYEDAKTASKELGLTLTKRNKKMDVPLAGIPYHSASSYIAKLVNKGYKVAICEQVEDPKEVKGIVKREVIRVITPGTIIDTDYLDEKNNNYLMGILIKDKSIGISYVDITTGEFKTSKLEGKNLLYKLLGEINKVYPKEILIDEKSLNFLQGELQSNRILEKINITKVQTMRNPEKYLLEYFEIQSLDSFGIKNNDDIISVCAMVLKYVVDLQKGNELPIRKISYVSTEKIMELNLTTQRNLDIVENYNRNDSGTLLGVLDFCKNSMGSRYLKRILKNPTLDIDEIHRRQNDIEYFINEVLVREEVREKLKDIYDIERIIGKLTLETVNGRDLVALKESIKNIRIIFY